MIESNEYCSWLDESKSIINKNIIELVKRKGKIFHQDNTSPHIFVNQVEIVQAELRNLHSPGIVSPD